MSRTQKSLARTVPFGGSAAFMSLQRENSPVRETFPICGRCSHSSGLKPAPRRVFLSAFTLVELLIVIGIIGLLAGLLLPALSRAKESGRSTACLSNLHQIGIALQLYVQDNQNTLPTMHDWSTNLVSNTNGPPINLVLSNYIGSSN